MSARGATHPAAWALVGLPAVPYGLVTRGLWSFLGCPPQSLAYPGHPAPVAPISGSLALIATMWVWFVVCGAICLLVHRALYARPGLWLRALSFLAPGAFSLAGALAGLVFVSLATLC